MTVHRPFRNGFQWQDVAVRAYKDGEGPYQGVTRQVLFDAEPGLPVEWRYFEVASGGHSTLERHEHLHFVAIVRGEGRALIEGTVRDVAPFDLIRIPSLSWHQFRAAHGAPLGFFCLVAADRDRPQLPTPDDLVALRADPAVAAFIRP